MKGTQDRLVWAAVLLVLAALLAIGSLLSLLGCGSSGADFQGPEIKFTGVPIPSPGPELECLPAVRGALADLQRAEVEADGATLIQACTQDILSLNAILEQYRDQCIDYNEARELIVKAQEEALAKLEAMNNQ